MLESVVFDIVQAKAANVQGTVGLLPRNTAS